MSRVLAGIVEGNIIDQPVDAIVNAWNRNLFPWWLLLPSGVAGAIRKAAGTQPFRELAQHGPMPLGSAVLTSAGKLPFHAIIHVAGINLLWRASEASIRNSVANALNVAGQHGFASLAIPVIGAGAGGFSHAKALALVTSTIDGHPFPGQVTIATLTPAPAR
jgi:O-acetyl-ADP-ribose deacetylase